MIAFKSLDLDSDKSRISSTWVDIEISLFFPIMRCINFINLIKLNSRENDETLIKLYNNNIKICKTETHMSALELIQSFDYDVFDIIIYNLIRPKSDIKVFNIQTESNY